MTPMVKIAKAMVISSKLMPFFKRSLSRTALQSKAVRDLFHEFPSDIAGGFNAYFGSCLRLFMSQKNVAGKINGAGRVKNRFVVNQAVLRRKIDAFRQGKRSDDFFGVALFHQIIIVV